MNTTSISWTEKTWNIVTGCTPVSEGCANCYAKRMAQRLRGRCGYPADEPFKVTLHEDKLKEPLRMWKPARIFVCSMGDLFHDDVPDEYIHRVFAVMALCPQHIFMVLTKRPQRMREYLSDSATPFRVARAIDSTGVARETADMVLETRPVPGYENYLVRNDGVIFSRHGSGACVNCGNNTTGYAKRRYCSQKCKEKAQYIERVGRPLPFPPTPTPMTPMPGEDGHMRVMLYREGIGYRELVHRLVLTAFVRPPQPGEQACHRTGDPTNNALPNLRWGTQQDNWQDRIRHGNGHSHGEVSYITPPISWPLSNCWAGVTAENQARADERIPLLLQTPAAARFVSVEPMLGPVDLSSWLPPFTDCDHYNGGCTRPENPLAETRDPSSRPGILSCTPSACVFGRRGLDWVICGGETGTNARPMHPDWVRSLRGQCLAARVPFHFKSWGQWAPERDTFDEIMSGETTCPVCGCTDSHACEGGCYWIVDADYRDRCSQCAGVKSHRWPDGSYSYRVGAALSGRLLDGREWDEYPEGTE